MMMQMETKSVFWGIFANLLFHPGEVLENPEGSQQLRLLLQLQPAVQPHRVGIGERSAETLRITAGLDREVDVCCSSLPVRWKCEDLGRKDREVSENFAGSFRPRLCRKSAIFIHVGLNCFRHGNKAFPGLAGSLQPRRLPDCVQQLRRPVVSPVCFDWFRSSRTSCSGMLHDLEEICLSRKGMFQILIGFDLTGTMFISAQRGDSPPN